MTIMEAVFLIFFFHSVAFGVSLRVLLSQ